VENYGLGNRALQKYVKDYNMHYRVVSKEKGGNIIRYISILTGWSAGIGVPYLMVFGRDGDMAGNPMLGDIREAVVDSMIQRLL